METARLPAAWSQTPVAATRPIGHDQTGNCLLLGVVLPTSPAMVKAVPASDTLVPILVVIVFTAAPADGVF
jgi:hypothetical protein